MSFLDDVRRQKIAAPTSPKFDLKKWSAQVEREGISTDDLQVMLLGQMFFIGLKNLREKLVLVPNAALANAAKRRALVALANRECLMADVILHEQVLAGVPVGELVSIDRAATTKIKLQTGEFTPDEIASTVIDGVGKLLAMCPIEGDGSYEDAAAFDPRPLARDVNVANLYLGAELLWADILWRGAHPLPGRETLTFVPGDVGLAGFEAVCQHRHLMTSVQRFKFAFDALRMRLQVNAPTVHRWALKATVADDQVHLARTAPSVTQMAYRLAVEQVVVPPYYITILQRPAPTQPSITLANVLEAFYSLATLSQSLAEAPVAGLKAERSATDGTVVALPTLVPWISRIQLVGRLAEAMGVSEPVAGDLVDFFTTAMPDETATGDRRADLWVSPLVYAGPDRLVMALHPFISPNTPWLLDRWLKRLGFDLDFRGTPFEDFARESLHATAAGSKLATVSTVYDKTFTFTTAAGRDEQIDLLLIINDLVVVGEAKCFLQPISPVDLYNHRAKLIEGVAQVQRKADAGRESRAEFIARARQLGIELPPDFRVAPVLVLNHAFGAGQTIGQVPVIDLAMAELFFEGSMQWRAVTTSRSDLRSSQVERFYDDPSTAAIALEKYLADPPQVRHLRNALSPRPCQVILPVGKSEGLISVVFDVDIDKIDWADVPGATPSNSAF